MIQPDQNILRAWLTSATTGVIELDADWLQDSLPIIVPGEKAYTLIELKPAPPELQAEESAYYVDAAGKLIFVLYPTEHSWLDFASSTVYVAGDFNGWQDAVGRPEWRMEPGELQGREVWLLRTDAAILRSEHPQQFKFVTGEQHWLELPPDASNTVVDSKGIINRVLYRNRTGRNLFQFTSSEPLEPSRGYSVIHLRDGQQSPKMRLRLGRYFHAMRSLLPLGALVRKDETIFRIFAPRAKYVRLMVSKKLEAPAEQVFTYELDQKTEGGEWRGVWEARLDRNMHAWYYWYSLGGPQNHFGSFHPSQKVLDPYAQAAVGHLGPGIVLDAAWVGKAEHGFKVPAWQDLVIAEAHVRDLAAMAPISLKPEERLGFAGLRQWVESPDFYLKKLGVNAVELQPVQEFDNLTRAEYHWGYMTCNWFAPASAYSSDPAKASGVKELQELVAAFHRQGIAVILDVVYNHAGEPAHLLFIDKLYYFELGDDGSLANWSGCGNDLRCRSAMMKRLIIDSCVHLMETYGVDGFRFDLAELIGVSVMRDVEFALKRAKPDVVLIAEPWSFRGHIAAALRPSGWTSWNDGYRDFMRDYVHGRGAADKLEYFIKGSPWHFAFWPAQTVNYTESHDDRTWLDVITENRDNNGHRPTLNDIRRTHLMAAIMFTSVGIPMMSAGQDFLRTKYGVSNTYKRGELNALDYRRIRRYSATHEYFAAWIAFRRSARGQLLRRYTRPGEGFFRAISGPDMSALVLIYNADGAEGPQKLMFAINPTLDDVTIPIGEVALESWTMVADQDCFYDTKRPAAYGGVTADLLIPGLGCGLWVVE